MESMGLIKNTSEWLFYLLLLYWGYCIIYGGWWQGFRRTKIARDYFIVNRSLSPWIFAIAATATSFSGWTFMSHPALIYSNGLQAAFLSLYAITIAVPGVFFLKRQWMLGKRCGFITPGDMFSAYFYPTPPKRDWIRFWVVMVALLFSIPYLAVQLRASGFLFEVLTDGQLKTDDGMWLMAIVLMLYVAIGGLRAVAYVDLLQLLLKASGIVVIGLIILYYIGANGWSDSWCSLTQGLAELAKFDTKHTPDGASHYVAIPDAIQFTKNEGNEVKWITDGRDAVGGAFTGMMIFTFLLALMGIQSSPAFSMWAFSNESPKGFVYQQVWLSSGIMGLILIVFSVIQGLGGHFLGADAAFREAHPGFVNNILGVFLADEDITVDIRAGKEDRLVPLFIRIIRIPAETVSLLSALLAVCALAAMQSTAAAYMSTTASMLTHDGIKRFFPGLKDGFQRLAGAMMVIIVTLVALGVASSATETLALLGALAVAYGLQMWPALIAICWWSFLTRRGIIWGIGVGLTVVTFTEGVGQQSLEYFLGIPAEDWSLRWPFTIHSAAWGIVANFIVAMGVSLLPYSEKQTEKNHREEKFHQFLKEHDGWSNSNFKKDWRFIIGVSAVSIWLMVAILGATFFPNTWIEIPILLWYWQIFWWLVGVGMMYYLAVRLKLSTETGKTETGKFEPLQED